MTGTMLVLSTITTGAMPCRPIHHHDWCHAMGKQEEQTTRPHCRQWCFWTKAEKCWPQIIQSLVMASGTHTAHIIFSPPEKCSCDLKCFISAVGGGSISTHTNVNACQHHDPTGRGTQGHTDTRYHTTHTCFLTHPHTVARLLSVRTARKRIWG